MINFNNMFPTSSRAAYPAPTFATSWLTRTSHLRLELEVECLGKLQRLKFDWRNVTLYQVRIPRGVEDVKRQIETQNGHSGNGERVDAGDDQEDLPRYEKHLDS